MKVDRATLDAMRGMDGFEKRELLGDEYWEDPRWKEVSRLHADGETLKANGLVATIRSDWGVL